MKTNMRGFSENPFSNPPEAEIERRDEVVKKGMQERARAKIKLNYE